MLSRSYKRYALVLLTSLYALSFMDRIVIGLLLQPIKVDLQLSDSQLGFLTGIAFALFYTVMGIPIARWADRGNRVTIVSTAIALWGVMVSLCGLATNFLQIVLVRIGAAVGEAGCMPPAYSLIGDYYPVKERSRALSVFMAGIAISIVVSFVLAGWMNDHYGWRMTLMVIGIPGLLMAVLAKLTLPEPRLRDRKGTIDQSTLHATPQQPLIEFIVILWRQTTLRRLIMALTMINFVGIGLGQWLPSFFIRNHQMDSTELGLWMGLLGGSSGVVGTLFGGYLLDRYFGQNLRAQLRWISLVVALFTPFYWLLLFVQDRQTALLMLIPINIIPLFFYGPVMGMIQQLVADNQRAIAIAVTLFCFNLIGIGLGPQAVGIISDLLSPSWGTAIGLQLSMAVAAIAAFGTVWCFWTAGKTIEEDLPIKSSGQDTASAPGETMYRGHTLSEICQQ